MAAAAAFVAAALGVAAQAGRDGLFLATLAATDLPPVMMASATLSIAATFALSAWLRRSMPLRVAPWVFVGSAGLFFIEWWMLERAPVPAAVALYLHVTGLIPVVVSALWSVANERFDPYTAKRAVSRMAAAGAFGSIIGGLGAERVVSLSGPGPLLLLLIMLSLVCAACIRGIGAPLAHPAHGEGAGSTAFAALRERPLLRHMATLMFLAAIVETLVEYALKAEAETHFTSVASLTRFFALFYMGCGVLSFILQLRLGPAVLQRGGLAVAVAMLPGGVALTGAVAAAVPALWSAVLVRGTETVMSGFFRAGFQLLYTSVPPSATRPAKVWVDVASGSAGEIAGAGLIFGALAVWHDIASAQVLIEAALLSAVALEIVRRIHHHYVEQLAESLRNGRVALRVEDALDATTARTITAANARVDRQTLLAEVRLHHQATRPDAGATNGSDEREVASSQPAPPGSELASADNLQLLEQLRALLSEDTGAARRVLRAPASGRKERQRDARRLTAHAIPLLNDPALAEDAAVFLRRVAPRAAGQLIDALLDPDEEPAVRARLASLLGEVDDPRLHAGLWRAMREGDFELRFAAARAGCRVRRRSPQATLPVADVHTLVERELAIDDATWERQGRRDGVRGDRSVLLRGRTLDAVSRSLEHVFTLLALYHPRDVMASVLAGLASGDPGLHGTALEYLESVLPPGLRAALWAHLDAPTAPGTAEARSPDSLADELLRSSLNVILPDS